MGSAWDNYEETERSKPKIELLGLAAGAPGSGKDTMFKLLEAHGFDVVNVKFADALTDETHDQFTGFAYSEFLEVRHSARMKDHPFAFFAIDKLMKGPYKDFLVTSGFDPFEKRSARWHLIQYGTEFVRKHQGQDDYWLRKGFKKAQEVYSSGKVPVITDVRFPNELERLHKIGGTSIYLFAPWSKKDGAQADGLIDPADCTSRFTNTEGQPKDLLTQFLQCYTMKSKGGH